MRMRIPGDHSKCGEDCGFLGPAETPHTHRERVRRPGEEVRIVDPNTGGAKGQKLAQLGAIDPLAILKMAEVAGFGAGKYARYNYVKGFDWSLSYDAMQRHLLAFWSGEDTDAESGQPHLAHAGWHCMSLLTFLLRGRGNDDRIHRFIESLGGGDSQ